jgi:hypothetical protein
MVRAAYQIRLDPAHGLEQTPDPFGSGLFDYSRFMVDGVESWFQTQVSGPKP